MAEPYGGLNVQRATASTSFGNATGTIFQNLIVTYKSTVRAIGNVRNGSATASIIAPCDVNGAASGRYTGSVFLDNKGITLNNKGYIQVSGVSTVAYVYWRNV